LFWEHVTAGWDVKPHWVGVDNNSTAPSSDRDDMTTMVSRQPLRTKMINS
jgi:hypothetical protein